MKLHTAKEKIRRLKKDGWYEIASKGGHRQFEHPTRSGKITVPFKSGKTLAPKTNASILRHAGIEKP
ncbi:MAG: type II toxin-antitoxin system HicA family toxin [Nitrospinota bacterium]